MSVIQMRMGQSGDLLNEMFLLTEVCRKTTLINSESDILGYVNALSNNTKIINVTVDAYLCSLFEIFLKESRTCRKLFTRLVLGSNKVNQYVVINVCVVDPKVQVFDKRGNRLFEQLGVERREVDNAMAWFSTLGGAFSALGDTMEHCAVMAGKISHKQFLLALRLNDPFLLARCRLYLALSLIQRGCFYQAKQIILSQYAFATSINCDQKLIAMCYGISAKWKYDRKKFINQLKKLPCK